MSLATSLQGNKIENWGAIQRAVVPADWQTRQSESHVGQERVWFVAPDGSGATINFFYRGQPATPTVAGQMSAVISRGTHNLTKDEIVLLQNVFGFNSVGSNQYTSFGARGTATYPACQVSSAEVIDLNGRHVLSVRCTFQDSNSAEPINETQAVYIQDGATSGMIQEIYYEVPKLPDFLRHLPDFEAVLKSVVWNW